MRLTGRLPVLVDLLAQTRPQDPADIEDPADTAGDRFLKWITDPDRREAALACALPLRLNEDAYRAAVPQAAADQYTWLRQMPFAPAAKTASATTTWCVPPCFACSAPAGSEGTSHG